MVPERRKPLTQSMQRAIASALDEAGCMGWSRATQRAMSVAYKYAMATGCRADEPTHPTDNLRRAALVIITPEGEEMEMSPANLERVRNGWMLRGHAPPSKCDRDDMEWGDRNEWFRVNFEDSLNFAAAWVRWELDFPCPVEQRAEWAAFSPTGGKAPFTTDTLQRRFNEVLVHALGENEAKRRSWHSMRVTVATALNTAKRSDGAVQCICRWKTLEAMRLYAKMDPTEYADLVDEITATRIDVTKARSLPATDPHDIVAVMDESMAWLAQDEATAAAALLDGGAASSAEAPAAAASAMAGKSARKRAATTGGEPSVKQRVAVAKRGEAARPEPPASELVKGDRLRVFWPDEDAWFVGTFTSSRRAESHDGLRLVRESRVAYDAQGGWRAEHAWHILDEEVWSRL